MRMVRIDFTYSKKQRLVYLAWHTNSSFKIRDSKALKAFSTIWRIYNYFSCCLRSGNVTEFLVLGWNVMLIQSLSHSVQNTFISLDVKGTGILNWGLKESAFTCVSAATTASSMFSIFIIHVLLYLAVWIKLSFKLNAFCLRHSGQKKIKTDMELVRCFSILMFSTGKIRCCNSFTEFLMSVLVVGKWVVEI